MRFISNNRPTENIRAALASRFTNRKWLMPIAYVAIAIFVLLVLVFIARGQSNSGPTAMVAPNGKGGMVQLSSGTRNSNAPSANAAPAANGDNNRPSGYPTDPSRSDALITKDYAAFSDPSNSGAVEIGFVGDKSAAGSPIHATHDGLIKTLRDDPTYGNLVYVIGKDYTTIYSHLQSISVSDGQSVKHGDNIGSLGSSGNMGAPRLDYQVWKCSGDPKASGTAARTCTNVNPADFLK